ncbi:MAG TPA: glycosyltransferase family 2 protein, partial [Ktedonobacterales bacterium]
MSQPSQPAQAPLISITLPVYNGARFLPESLASIVAQTYTNWELICVDDTSTDATPTVLAEWAARDARIHVIRHEVNKRLPGALNTGFAAARGELLTWTSDDNRYRPDAL